MFADESKTNSVIGVSGRGVKVAAAILAASDSLGSCFRFENGEYKKR